MQTPGTSKRRLPLLPVVSGVLVLAMAVSGLFYLNRPARKNLGIGPTTDAKAYLSHLDLKDVTMKASENFMNQQVVEVEGTIGNNGPRPLRSIEVFCLFYGVDGHELYRKRVPVLSSGGPALKPGEARHFRLPFDNLPEGWNQALPKMVIAQINFAG